MNHTYLTQKLSLFTLLISLLTLLAACNKDRHNHPNLRTGKDFFNHHCASCHKEDGSGLFLKSVPANIASNKNQTEIIFHIKQGNQNGSTNMPVFRKMPDEEAKKITNYLLILKRNYFNNPDNKNKMLLKRQK